MDGTLCDQVVSILIDPGYNYSYVNLDLVDKCGLNKEVHAKSWLVQLNTGTKKIVHHWVISCEFEFNGPQPGEQQNRGDGRRKLQCWTCGKEHLKKYFPQNQGGRPQI